MPKIIICICCKDFIKLYYKQLQALHSMWQIKLFGKTSRELSSKKAISEVSGQVEGIFKSATELLDQTSKCREKTIVHLLSLFNYIIYRKLSLDYSPYVTFIDNVICSTYCTPVGVELLISQLVEFSVQYSMCLCVSCRCNLVKQLNTTFLLFKTRHPRI